MASSVKEKVSEEEILQGMNASSSYDYIFNINKMTDKAECKLCLATFSYNQRTSGTSSLKRHLQSKHLAVSVKRQQLTSSSVSETTTSGTQRRLTDFPVFSKQRRLGITEISKTDRCIITLCCSKHVLPPSFFEDIAVSEGFDLPCINRRKVREGIIQLSPEIKDELLEKNRGQWTNLILDGWKNSVTGGKHVTVMMFLFNQPAKPIFLRSYVLEKCGAEETLACIDGAVRMLAH